MSFTGSGGVLMGTRLDGDGERCLGCVEASATGELLAVVGTILSSGEDGARVKLGLADLKRAATRAPGPGEGDIAWTVAPGLAPCVLASNASQPPLPLPLPACAYGRVAGAIGSVGIGRGAVAATAAVEGT